MPRLLKRLVHLEAVKQAEDGAPRFYLNCAGRNARRVEANGMPFERGADESPEDFESRIKSACGKIQFITVRAVCSEEEWVAEVAEHYRKHPVGQSWKD